MLVVARRVNVIAVDSVTSRHPPRRTSGEKNADFTITAVMTIGSQYFTVTLPHVGYAYKMVFVSMKNDFFKLIIRIST